MRRTLAILTISLMCSSLTASVDQEYDSAYEHIVAQLEGRSPYSFKSAVFAVEKAYDPNDPALELAQFEIEKLTLIVKGFLAANKQNFSYKAPDRDRIALHGSLFSVLTDTVKIVVGDSIHDHLPYTYDFNDIWGTTDWKNMFVSKLLMHGKGNCHSLPYLYKILAEELGENASLALAPNHLYIKIRSERDGMYNTELTSGSFPIDAWLMSSGYIHLDAVRNGVYMDTLDRNESLALCLIDLAKGFQRAHGSSNLDFITKCCDKALYYYPNFVNAMLLKAESIKLKIDLLKESTGLTHAEVVHAPGGKELFAEYEELISQIYTLGYRKMPETMYLDWLEELTMNQEQYTNKRVNISVTNNTGQ